MGRWFPGPTVRPGPLVRISSAPASSQARCAALPHFGLCAAHCGGRSMQHLVTRGPGALKQRVLEERGGTWDVEASSRIDAARSPGRGDYRYTGPRLVGATTSREGRSAVWLVNESASSFVAEIRE